MELALIGVCLLVCMPAMLLLLVKCVLVFLEEEREREHLGTAQQGYMEAQSAHSYARALDALLRARRPYRRPSPQRSTYPLSAAIEELLQTTRKDARDDAHR